VGGVALEGASKEAEDGQWAKESVRDGGALSEQPDGHSNVLFIDNGSDLGSCARRAQPTSGRSQRGPPTVTERAGYSSFTLPAKVIKPPSQDGGVSSRPASADARPGSAAARPGSAARPGAALPPSVRGVPGSSRRVNASRVTTLPMR
jgi:hypothetical protein